jgi:hypothetical protein
LAQVAVAALILGAAVAAAVLVGTERLLALVLQARQVIPLQSVQVVLAVVALHMRVLEVAIRYSPLSPQMAVRVALVIILHLQALLLVLVVARLVTAIGTELAER